MHNTPTLRVARPTDDLSALLQFYREGLGMTVLYEFKDHDGFDGVMLGWQGAPYHLEFTHAQGHMAGRAPTEDNLLIFYVPDPYWDRCGRTFEDPDGYRVVIQRDRCEL